MPGVSGPGLFGVPGVSDPRAMQGTWNLRPQGYPGRLRSQTRGLSRAPGVEPGGATTGTCSKHVAVFCLHASSAKDKASLSWASCCLSDDSLSLSITICCWICVSCWVRSAAEPRSFCACASRCCRPVASSLLVVSWTRQLPASFLAADDPASRS